MFVREPDSYSRFADFFGDSKISFRNFTEHLQHIAAASTQDAQKTVAMDRCLMPNDRQSRNLPCGCGLSGRYELIHGSYAQQHHRLRTDSRAPTTTIHGLQRSIVENRSQNERTVRARIWLVDRVVFDDLTMQD